MKHKFELELKMFLSRMDALILALVLSSMIGCSALNGQKACCHSAKSYGTVRTTGAYAISRTIQIPADGLLLGDAVEKALRPGVIQGSVSSGPPVTTRIDVPIAQRPPQVNMIQVTIAGFEADKDDPAGSLADLQSKVEVAARRDGRILIGDATKLHSLLKAAIDTHVLEPAMASIKKERQKLQDLLIQDVDPLFGPPSAIASAIYQFTASGNTANDIPSLRAKIETAAASSNRSLSPGGSTDLLLAINHSIENGSFATGAGRDDLVSQVEKLYHTATAKASAVQPIGPSAATQGNNGFSSAVVVLTRRNATRIIAPLTSVRSSVPGDIMLQDQDRIEICDFRATSASRPSSFMDGQVGEILVSTWMSNEGLKVPTTPTTTVADAISSIRNNLTDIPHDTIVLNRLSELGQFEQYLLPKDDQYWLNAANLQHSDHVQLQALELSPLIRDSRRAQLIAVANLRSTGKTGLKPIVSEIDSATKSLDDHFQQFTGVDKADICKETQSNFGNIGSLVAPGLR